MLLDDAVKPVVCDDGKTKMKKEWMCNLKSTNYRLISDIVHNSIPMCHPVDTIMDSKPFQRLRRLKQLGVAFHVFPSATHDRFTHSLGVYHLAREMCEHLQRDNPDCGITSTDILCVSIAGLIHDLGHGPFSHVYDSRFLKAMDVHGFKHEKMSCDIFDHLYRTNSKVRNALNEFLDPDKDITFIKELVNPPKALFDDQGCWLLDGRTQEKAFLYEIVNNPHTGLDVDKIDYLLRDSLITRVDIPFSKDQWNRCLNNMEVQEWCSDKGQQLMRIHFDEKALGKQKLLENVFNSRLHMHEIVYQHKTVVAVEIRLLQVLQKANEHLKFRGSDGHAYKMSDAFQNIDAFLKLSDNLLERIRSYLDDICSAPHPDMVEANELLEKIEDDRHLPKLVGQLCLKSAAESSPGLDAKIQAALARLEPPLQGNVHLRVVSIHQGKGTQESPMDSFVVCRDKNGKKRRLEQQQPQQKRKLSSAKKTGGGQLYVYAYVSYEQRDAPKDKKQAALNVAKEELAEYMEMEQKENVPADGGAKKLKHISNDLDENNEDEKTNELLSLNTTTDSGESPSSAPALQQQQD